MKNPAQNKKQTEKCLICILGQARADELTWESFKLNVLDQLNADLALCVASEKEDVIGGNEFYAHADYIWQYDEPVDYGELFDFAKSALNSSENWRILLKIKDQWLGGILGKGAQPGSAGILIFCRWLLLKNLVENGLLEKYDRFIITRSDYIYCAPHPPLKLISPEFIWFPEGENYGGYTDRHLVVSSKDVISCINLMEEIILRPNRMYRKMWLVRNWNLERVLAFHFKNKGLDERVRIFPQVMFTVREKGGKTSWSEGEFSDEFGFYIKYRSEFERSYQTYCPKIENNDDWQDIFAEFDINGIIKPAIYSPIRIFLNKKISSIKKRMPGAKKQ